MPNEAKNKQMATAMNSHKIKQICKIQQKQCEDQVFPDPIPSMYLKPKSRGLLAKGDTRQEAESS